ncbi:MAG: FIST C-terminal domain-containing protein [Rhodocyclaceae bacterium]|nr:FIST C-terminal domain-containing protein [Rhodocyclaceae bacterium]
MKVAVHLFDASAGWNTPLVGAMDSPSTLVLVFGGSESSPLASAFADLSATFPQAARMGCSSSGEIYGRTLIDNSLVVAVIQFERTTLRMLATPLASAAESFNVGAEIAQSLLSERLKSVFVLSEGLAVNGSQLVNGLASILPPQVVVTGGLAGDGPRFEKTWVLVDGAARRGYVTAVGLYGEAAKIAHGSKGGLDVLGPEREVTHSSDNVLYRLDGQPALLLYKRYLGARAAELPASGLLFPLAIRNELEEDGHTVRTILSINEADNSITFAGDIPQGSLVRLMRANTDRLIDGAADAAAMMNPVLDPANQSVCIAISCVGRRLVLGQRAEEEIDAVANVLPLGTHLIGYYSYGEISPLASGRCDLHNQTMTLTTFQED